MPDSDKKKCPCGCGAKGCVCPDDCKGDCIGKASDSDKNNKKGMVMVISVGGKSPKNPEDTSKPDVKKAPIPEATAGMGEKPRESVAPPAHPGLQGIIDSMNSSVGQAKGRREEFDASEEGQALAEAPQEEQDFRQLDRFGAEIKPGPVSQSTQDLQMRTEPSGSPKTQDLQLLQALNQAAIRDSHYNPMRNRPPGVDPPMPETSPADEGSLPAPKRPYEKKPFPDEGRPVIGGPSTIAEFESGREPKNIFARSFDGPLNYAWSLLKFVNKRKYAQMTPEDSDSQPGGVYDSLYNSPSEEEEEEEESMPTEDGQDDGRQISHGPMPGQPSFPQENMPSSPLEQLLQLLGENPDRYDEETSRLSDEVQNERSPARGLSNLQDPFRMKRPEMANEMLDMDEEKARRWHSVSSRYGQEEGEEELPQFSMNRPEMDERRSALQSEMARRGKPLVNPDWDRELTRHRGRE
jgi:hypothetical protein